MTRAAHQPERLQNHPTAITGAHADSQPRNNTTTFSYVADRRFRFSHNAKGCGAVLLANLHGQSASAGLPDIVLPDYSGRVMPLINDTK